MIKSVLKQNKYIKNAYDRFKKKWKRYWIQKDGLKELSLITRTLNNNEIMSFADFGTMLGLIREGKLLEHDLDIDVGVICKGDNSKKIERLFCKMNYHKSREFVVQGKLAEQSFEKNWIKIDIQYYYEDACDDKMFCFLFYNRNTIKDGYWQTVKKRCNKVNKVKQVRVKQYRIYIPENAEELLECKYGTSWKTPDKGWNYWEGPNTERIDDLGKLYTSK